MPFEVDDDSGSDGGNGPNDDSENDSGSNSGRDEDDDDDDDDDDNSDGIGGAAPEDDALAAEEALFGDLPEDDALAAVVDAMDAISSPCGHETGDGKDSTLALLGDASSPGDSVPPGLRLQEFRKKLLDLALAERGQQNDSHASQVRGGRRKGRPRSVITVITDVLRDGGSHKGRASDALQCQASSSSRGSG